MKGKCRCSLAESFLQSLWTRGCVRSFCSFRVLGCVGNRQPPLILARIAPAGRGWLRRLAQRPEPLAAAFVRLHTELSLGSWHLSEADPVRECELLQVRNGVADLVGELGLDPL